MYYAIVKNNAIENAGLLKDLFPTTSFPVEGPTEDFLSDNSIVKVLESIEHDSVTHKMVYCDPYLLDGKVYNVIAEAFTTAEKKENSAAVKAFNALQGE